ncbi:MAG: Gfo/Idh/MocA family oxidoreductase [Defluviitaleaceae bacterium]|nr:Gfo/Idh/MocA family oxidoreductase [Defluviitaleaceae bacterium]
MDRQIKIGVVGAFRGMSLASNAAACGMKIAAVCDKDETRLASAEVGADAARCADYDDFLGQDIEAVVLANYFHEHAPFAIKALRAGKHVLSETSCNFTLAEGASLCEAVEETGQIYMLAENYPYTKFNQELRRLYQSGELGDAVYAEGEYNHPMSDEDCKKYVPDESHWRSWLPPGYYATHALAPLMYITGLMPKTVVGFQFGAGSGWAGLCKMEGGAVFKLLGGGAAGHSVFYRIHGTRGAAEITRGPGYFGPENVRVWHEPWDAPQGVPLERVYAPEWPDEPGEADGAGHGGGDFWVCRRFAQAVRSNAQPFLDVYRGVAMSSAGILLWRSMQAGGAPQDVPDFRDKAARESCGGDDFRPNFRRAAK